MKGGTEHDVWGGMGLRVSKKGGLKYAGWR